MLNPASSNRTKDLRFSNARNSSEGKVICATKVWAAPSDFYGTVPYNVALIKLADGTITIGQVVGSEEISAGMKVEACIRRMNIDSEKGIIEYGTKFKVIK